MEIENRVLNGEDQPATPSTSDAYEVYWRSTDEDGSANAINGSSPAADSWQSGGTGNAYSELWQHWDAQ